VGLRNSVPVKLCPAHGDRGESLAGPERTKVNNMKVVSVFGSPRKKGNTAKVLTWVEEALVDQGHEVDRINVTKYKVNGCVACYTCQSEPDRPGCPQKDDALEIFNQMIDADAIIYASPLFCWSWTAQIKPLIDRHFCLVTEAGGPAWKSLLEEKRIGLVMTAAGPMEENADVLVKQFDALVDYAKARVADHLVVPFCTTPDALGDEAKQQAVKFAETLVK
jgi:NAD(P)H-dependent FMN reductase